MITLKADNRVLATNAKYSYLANNYASGVSALVITNSEGFAADDYVLLGEFGSETSEICQISTVVGASNQLNLSAATGFAHSESTKVSILKYNQVRFYHTTTATFGSSDPVTDYIDIQADSLHSKAYDTTNTTGFGWFIFYNETTAKATDNSNAIPYAGFGENSVKKIFDNFYSLLNNKEKKLITNADAFSWLNEAYAIAVNELNLVNQEYNAEDTGTIDTVASTKEYSLSSNLTNFSEIISVYDTEDDEEVGFIKLKDVYNYDESSQNERKYFIRGDYIGFSPTPNDVRTYNIRYKSKSTTLSSYYDNVVLPDNNFYCLVDYMIYRAAPKLNRGNAQSYYKAFYEGIKRMKVTSHKRDDNLDSWGVSASANV